MGVRRNVGELLEQVKAELRAEGAEGIQHYSEDLMMTAINHAIDQMAGVFPIRYKVELSTEEGVNTYSIDVAEEHEVEIDNVLWVEYDGDPLTYVQPESFLKGLIPTEGTVREWTLWGDELILVGDVKDDKDLVLWCTRAPKHVVDSEDIPETPYYADEALVHYAVSTCYRESRNYERANYHYSIYVQRRDEVLRRGVTQKHRAALPRMSASYWEPHDHRRRFVRSDTDPGGRYR